MKFQKGHVPACPIKKGQRISRDTEFKKGSVPRNKLPVGTIKVRKHKADVPRRWIKVAEPNVWILNAIHVWLLHGGTVPKGFVIHHLDRNALNDDIKNLCVLSRAGHLNAHHEVREKQREARRNGCCTKDVICSLCDKTFTGKVQRKKALCPKCKRIASNEWNRHYKQRLRAEARSKRQADTP